MSKRRFNRVLCIAVLLILTLLLISASLCTIKAQAAEISPDGNTWSALQDAIANAESGDTIVLNADVTAAESDIALSIPDGTVLSLDLNGRTINRHLTSPKGSDGAVITVQSGAVLTIKDSSEGAAGKITGGYASHGGGIRNNGTLIVEGGAETLRSFLVQNLWDEIRVETNTRMTVRDGTRAPQIPKNAVVVSSADYDGHTVIIYNKV